MHDDLPEPVAPAMSRCGISARFTVTDLPEMSRPRATSSGCAAACSVSTSTSPTVTIWRTWFGTSMPIAERPGIGARMRTSGVARA